MAERNDIQIRILAELADLRRDLQQVAGIVDQTGSRVSGAFDGAQASLAKFGLAIQGAREALNLMVTPIAAIVRTSAEFETLETRLVSLYGSAEAGARAFQTLADVAANTPFSLQGVVDAGATLKAFGADAEGLAQTIADLAAFMSVDITEAASAFGRAFSAGAGAADVLRERGVLNLIRSFKGIEDLSKLTLPQFRDALIETLQDPAANIAGSADRLAQTFTGSVSNMNDAIDQLKDALGDQLRPALQDVVQSIGELATWAKDNLPLVTNLLKGLSVALAGVGVAAATAAIPSVIAGITTAITALSGVLAATPFGAIVAGLGAVAAAIVYLWPRADEAADSTGNLADELGRAGREAEGAASGLRTFDQAIRQMSLTQAETELRNLVNRWAQLTQLGADPLALQGLNLQIDLIQEQIERLREKAAIEEQQAAAAAAASRIKAQALIDENEAERAGYEAYRAFLEQRFEELKKQGDATLEERSKLYIQIQKLDDAHQKQMLAQQKKAEAEREKSEQDANRKRLAGLQAVLNEGTVMQRGNTDEQLALLDELEFAYRDNLAALQAIADARAGVLEAAATREQQAIQQLGFAVLAISEEIGRGLQAAFEGSLSGLKESLKAALLMILDAVKLELQAASIASVARGLITGGLSALKDLPQLLAIEALFAGLRASVTAFETGGVADRPTLALLGESIATSGPEIVAPERHFKKWATDVLLPHLDANARGGGLDDESKGLLRGVREDLQALRTEFNPYRMGDAMGRRMRVQLRGAF